VIGPHGAARQLPSLALGLEGASAYPLDPAVAHGDVAIALASNGDPERPELTFERHRGRGLPVRGTAAGSFLGVDETGTIWLARGRRVVSLRDGAPVVRAELELASPIEEGEPSRDGAFAVVRAGAEVVAIDARGGVRWRRETLQPLQLVISGDGRTVAVATVSGIVALDSATGERRVWACGWHFGLDDAIGEPLGAACRPD